MGSEPGRPTEVVTGVEVRSFGGGDAWCLIRWTIGFPWYRLIAQGRD
jgi:hypothetical protein